MADLSALTLSPQLLDLQPELLACIAAVPACCMRLRATHPRMSAGAGVTTRTPIVEYKQVTIASPSEGPPAQEITVVSTYMCRMHQ